MNKKGFTLVELLGVIVILSLLIMLVIPTVIGVVKNYGKETDKVVLTMIEDATKLYIEENNRLFNKENGNNYCIAIDDLVEKKYLKDSIEYNGEDITHSKSIKATYDDGFSFELVDTNSCISNQIICTSVTEETKTLGNIPLGRLNAGDEYICTVGEEESYNFFVLNNNDGMVTLISSENIGNTVEWASDTTNNGPVTSFNYLNELTSNWQINSITNYNYKNNNGYKKIQIDKGITRISDVNNEKIFITGKTKARISTLDELLLSASKVNVNLTEENLNKYVLDNLSSLNEYYSVSATTVDELLELTNTKTYKDLWLLISKYIKEKNIDYDIALPNWMYSNLGLEGEPTGYWSLSTNSTKASYIDNSGIPNFSDVNVNNSYGIRPVIELSKYQMQINIIEETDGIPDEYIKLEYIQSTGTQYIDTNYIPNSDTNVIYDFEYLSGRASSYIPILAQRKTTTQQLFGFWVYSSNYNITINYDTTDTLAISGTNGFGRHIHSNVGNKFYLDNELVIEVPSNEFEANYPLSVFGLNTGTTTENRELNGRVYSLEIYEDSNLVKNFIPAKRKSDNEPGLFDTVSQEFYINSGTGDFEYPGCFEDNYTQLEYLESTGTQYIDTKYTANQNTRWELTIALTDIPEGKTEYINGSSSGGNTRIAIGHSPIVNANQFYFGIADKNTSLGTADTNKHTFFIDLGQKKYGYDELVAEYNYTVSYNSKCSMLLFNRNDGKKTGCKQQLYNSKIYDNGILVRDFIPAKRKSDNKVGLYDIVNHIFYTNSGTGEFIVP